MLAGNGAQAHIQLNSTHLKLVAALKSPSGTQYSRAVRACCSLHHNSQCGFGTKRLLGCDHAHSKLLSSGRLRASEKANGQGHSVRLDSCKIKGSIRANAASGTADATYDSGQQGGIRRLFFNEHDRDIFGLAIPALFSILLDPLMTLTDSALVGRLGSTQLGAVGLSSILFAFAAVVFNFLLFVTTPVVAAAVAQGDREKVSVVTAQGLWVALVSGTLLAFGIWFSAPFVVTRLLKASPEVAVYAITYLRCRSIACPALLGIFVAIGSFRGHKDTKTPLLASILSNFVNLGLDIFLMFGLGWGIAGAALATSASQFISFGILYWKLKANGILQTKHMHTVPKGSEIAPLLKSGAALSLRSVVMMGTYVTATTLIAGLGATTLAASEILRQVYIISIQAFTAMDIASQTLVATYLGEDNRRKARNAMTRVLSLGSAIGLVVGSIIFFNRRSLPQLFSKDPTVLAMASKALILQSVTLPLDALGASLDGALIGSSDVKWVSSASFFISGACFAALFTCRRLCPSLINYWLCMKLMSVGRVLSGAIRLSSRNSRLSV